MGKYSAVFYFHLKSNDNDPPLKFPRLNTGGVVQITLFFVLPNDAIITGSVPLNTTTYVFHG